MQVPPHGDQAGFLLADGLGDGGADVVDRVHALCPMLLTKQPILRPGSHGWQP